MSDTAYIDLYVCLAARYNKCDFSVGKMDGSLNTSDMQKLRTLVYMCMLYGSEIDNFPLLSMGKRSTLISLQLITNGVNGSLEGQT